MLVALALVGAGFLSAIGWFGANQYLIDPYLKGLPAPQKYCDTTSAPPSAPLPKGCKSNSDD